MVIIYMCFFGKEIYMLLFSIFCLYDLGKIFILCTIVYAFSMKVMLLGLWGYCSLIYSKDRLYASLIDLMPVTEATGENKSILGMLERSVKAPQAEKTVQDNTLAWC